MNSFMRSIWIGFVLFSCVGLDQITKRIAENKLRSSATLSYWGDSIRLQYTENVGAWGSMGSTLPPNARFWLLTLFPALFMAALAAFLIRRKDISEGEAGALALILGGGVGNLIDRVVFGYVVDFMWMGVGRIGTNIFNVADVAIVTGAGLLIFVQSRAKSKNQVAP